MTVEDVMAEFGILVERSVHESEELMRARRARPVLWRAYFEYTHQPWPDHITEGCATPSDAVCALLKARYGMTADIVNEIGGMEVVTTVWIARTSEGQWAAQPSELAAVVALARRIRGTG